MNYKSMFIYFKIFNLFRYNKLFRSLYYILILKTAGRYYEFPISSCCLYTSAYMLYYSIIIVCYSLLLLLNISGFSSLIVLFAVSLLSAPDEAVSEDASPIPFHISLSAGPLSVDE